MKISKKDEIYELDSERYIHRFINIQLILKLLKQIPVPIPKHNLALNMIDLQHIINI